MRLSLLLLLLSGNTVHGTLNNRGALRYDVYYAVASDFHSWVSSVSFPPPIRENTPPWTRIVNTCLKAPSLTRSLKEVCIISVLRQFSLVAFYRKHRGMPIESVYAHTDSIPSDYDSVENLVELLTEGGEKVRITFKSIPQLLSTSSLASNLLGIRAEDNLLNNVLVHQIVNLLEKKIAGTFSENITATVYNFRDLKLAPEIRKEFRVLGSKLLTRLKEDFENFGRALGNVSPDNAKAVASLLFDFIIDLRGVYVVKNLFSYQGDKLCDEIRKVGLETSKPLLRNISDLNSYLRTTLTSLVEILCTFVKEHSEWNGLLIWNGLNSSPIGNMAKNINIGSFTELITMIWNNKIVEVGQILCLHVPVDNEPNSDSCVDDFVHWSQSYGVELDRLEEELEEDVDFFPVISVNNGNLNPFAPGPFSRNPNSRSFSASIQFFGNRRHNQ